MKFSLSSNRMLGVNVLCTALVGSLVFSSPFTWAALPAKSQSDLRAIAESIANVKPLAPREQKTLPVTKKPQYIPVDHKPSFDIPVTYNQRVRDWIKYFQGRGKVWYTKWLERSHRYLPHMQDILADKSMPRDLAYVAMIESGFSPHAVSTASAVGYWQFIKSTANRYGLQTNWWIDERRDFSKSTVAAANYLSDLYKMFGSWYLTAAAYNMGEGRLKRLIKKYGTDNFWALAKKRDFPDETSDYIPKLIAAMLIAKAPKLYGFHEVTPKKPYSYEYFHVPGGTDLLILADELGISRGDLKRLNPELLRGFVPSFVNNHRIRIPRGFTTKVAQIIRSQIQ